MSFCRKRAPIKRIWQFQKKSPLTFDVCRMLLTRLIGNSQCIHHAITYFPRFEYHFVVALNDSENGSFKNIWRVCGSIFTNQSRLALIWNTFIMITTMVSEVISLFCNFICNFAVNENGVAVGCIRRGRLVITFQSATSFYNDWAISALLFKKTKVFFWNNPSKSLFYVFTIWKFRTLVHKSKLKNLSNIETTF